MTREDLLVGTSKSARTGAVVLRRMPGKVLQGDFDTGLVATEVIAAGKAVLLERPAGVSTAERRQVRQVSMPCENIATSALGSAR